MSLQYADSPFGKAMVNSEVIGSQLLEVGVVVLLGSGLLNSPTETAEYVWNT